MIEKYVNAEELKRLLSMLVVVFVEATDVACEKEILPEPNNRAGPDPHPARRSERHRRTSRCDCRCPGARSVR